MSNVFGTKFILVNKVQQQLPPKLFGGGPWLHLATVVRGFQEYCCFKHVPSGKIYIEYVDPTLPTLFKVISDDNEFNDLRDFLVEQGVLSFGVGQEMQIAKELIKKK
tara:strand:- start:1466 stop:1786 length:321 start_codon:yes stop_codon:yes gene_type:complete